jgi:hypothetical protein
MNRIKRTAEESNVFHAQDSTVATGNWRLGIGAGAGVLSWQTRLRQVVFSGRSAQQHNLDVPRRAALISQG